MLNIQHVQWLGQKHFTLPECYFLQLFTSSGFYASDEWFTVTRRSLRINHKHLLSYLWWKRLSPCLTLDFTWLTPDLQRWKLVPGRGLTPRLRCKCASSPVLWGATAHLHYNVKGAFIGVLMKSGFNLHHRWNKTEVGAGSAARFSSAFKWADQKEWGVKQVFHFLYVTSVTYKKCLSLTLIYSLWIFFHFSSKWRLWRCGVDFLERTRRSPVFLGQWPQGSVSASH